MSLDIERVDQYTLSDRLLDEYCDLVLASLQIDQPHSPTPSRELLIAFLRPEQREPERSVWFATSGNRLVGYANVNPLNGTNAAIVEVLVRVHPDHRRSGVGTALLREISPYLGDGGRTVVFGSADEGTAGEAWAKSLGFEVTDGNIWQRLEVTAADRSLWDVAPVPGFTLRTWTDETPDDLLTAYARARDAIHDRPKGASYDVPRWTADAIREDERELRAQGVEHRVVVAVEEATGEVAGLTIMVFKVVNPAVGYQRDTAVVRHHRGKGLGLWVKAAMLHRVVADRPALTRVTTAVATTNTHMARINRSLGFADRETVLVLEQSTASVAARLRP